MKHNEQITLMLSRFCSASQPLPQKQRDPEQQRLRMTRGWSVGFTLIELLVVVLIIGILSAIALPQYEKAVEKSRAMQALTLTKSIGDALTIYKLTNGSLPASFDELDVHLPGSFSGNINGYSLNLFAKSDADWSAGIEGGDYPSVHVTRISGKYKGAGFSYYFRNLEDLKEYTIVCTEIRQGSSYAFEKQAGDFCEKIFNGTKVSTGWMEHYKIP